ncbi:MAG: FGGY family carbohydrate kinase [Actinomycetota bacterium]
MALVLGVGMSALSTQVEVRDADDGRLLVAGRAAHERAVDGRVDVDPGLWWQALVDARRDAGGALGVNAIAVAAQSDGLVLLDTDGRLLRPAVFGSDATMQADADWLVRDLGGRSSWATAVGAIPDPASAVVKLAHLRYHEADLFARLGKVLLPHDYLTFRIVRRCVTDRGDASTTGYWSPRENRWRADVLRVVDGAVEWGRCLPEVLGPNEPAGDREGVVVAPGTGTQQAVALAIGMRPGDVVLALDRSGVCFGARERLTEDPTGRVADRADAAGRFLPTVRTLRARDVLETLAGQLGLDLGFVEQMVLSAPPGAGGVRCVPFREGEDAGHPPAAGRLTGLGPGVTREHVARALMEGIVCGLLDALEALGAAGVPTSGRLWVTGAAARSNAFQRVVADLAQRPVSVPREADAGGLGAAMQAAAVLHGVSPDEIAAAWGMGAAREVEPDGRVDAGAIRADYARPG